ncbi:MAG: biotin-dependent carboxyltransferase family protein [Phycisphaerales bacterium]
MGTLRVINPGMLTTVQDLGRPGFASMGVPTGGAADSLSLRIANRLVGNANNAAGLEMTLLGGSFEFENDALIAIAGGEARVEIASKSGALRNEQMCTRIQVRSGDTVRVGPIVRGVRTYLSIAGGIDVPQVLRSASTLLSAKFGGLQGRALQAGDQISWRDAAMNETPNPQASFKIRASHLETRASELSSQLLGRSVLRATDGPHLDEFDAASREAFWNGAFRVSSRSDRVGVRLESVHNHIANASSGGRMPSMGMMCGAVQVPPGGAPIILMADHPTTGGYPVIACVASVDLPRLGQLRPGETIRFARVTREDALRAFQEQKSQLAAMERDA